MCLIFLILTHPDFINASEAIAGFHRNYDGMTVEVITTTQVYNEFGSGIPDATAIRNFIRMFYDRSKKIKYVMLVGDGSYDNRNILEQTVHFFLPFSPIIRWCPPHRLFLTIIL
jgi:hypothetical protein